MKFYTLSWDNLQNNIFVLSNKIINSKLKFDLIVAIARGGLTISHILADFLNLPITSFTVKSYNDLKQKKTPKIIFKIANKLDKKKILLVDDVSDTGKTYIKGIEYLKNIGVKDIKTAALFIKPWTKFIPDFYNNKLNSWVIFPYEMKETIESLTRVWKKEGKSLVQIKRKLNNIKIPKIYIERYVK